MKMPFFSASSRPVPSASWRDWRCSAQSAASKPEVMEPTLNDPTVTGQFLATPEPRLVQLSEVVIRRPQCEYRVAL